jgi:hypothetical protein
MFDGELPKEEVLRTTQVGDTLRMTIDRSRLHAEVRDRVAPVLQAIHDGAVAPTLEGFVKDAAGEWDLESVIGAKASPTVEIVVRRIAASI